MSIRAVALTAALILTVTACGGDTADTTTPTLPTLSEDTAVADETATTTTTEAVDPEDALQDYSECMREHGVEMPDPESGDGGGVISIAGGDDLDFAAVEEAAAECDPILEAAFGEFELSPEQEAEMMDQQLAFSQCMRDEGIDWPDPDTSGGLTIEIPGDVDPERLDQAMKACSESAFGGEGGIMVGSPGPTP